MKFRTEKKHVIDILFPISLFFVFAASSLAVILLSANIYSRTVQDSVSSFETRTVLSYLTEKIHQNDENGAVSLGSLNGIDALVMEQSYEQQTYATYLYEYEGTLRELFVQKGAAVSPAAGKEIMPIADFHIAPLAAGLFEFSCTTPEGDTAQTIVSVKSESSETSSIRR